MPTLVSEIGLYDSLYIKIDESSICSLTKETPQEAKDKFLALCERHLVTLARMSKMRDEKREWNYAHPGEGKDWPEFRLFEKFLKQLLNEAGIVDT